MAGFCICGAVTHANKALRGIGHPIRSARILSLIAMPALPRTLVLPAACLLALLPWNGAAQDDKVITPAKTIDLLAAMEAKIDKNAAKYPVEQVRGSAKKYSEYGEDEG